MSVLFLKVEISKSLSQHLAPNKKTERRFDGFTGGNLSKRRRTEWFGGAEALAMKQSKHVSGLFSKS
jgi:hypothetical protein